MKKDKQVFFYKQNLEVLKFDDVKDVLFIQFDHYIKRKENLQRMNKDLPLGHFYLTTREVGERYSLHTRQAKRIIDKFIKLGIIEPVAISNSKGKASIYRYESVTNKETVRETDRETVNKKSVTNKTSKINGFENTDVTDREKSVTNGVTNDVTNRETYKIDFKTDKEKDIKKDINNIYSHPENDISQIRSLYPGTKNKSVADKKLPKLIDKYGKEQLMRGIERYNQYVLNERANGFDSLRYKNESTWWNSGYTDYLDENYQKPSAGGIEHSKGIIRSKAELIQLQYARSEKMIASIMDEDEEIDF